jgi:hypothetical protein
MTGRLLLSTTVSLCLGGCFPALPPEEPDGGTDTTVGNDGQEPDAGPRADLSQPAVTDKACETSSDCDGLAATCQVATCEARRCVIGTATDGMTCDDGNLCTEEDACTAGECAGRTKACPAVSQCHLAGTCVPGTGECSSPPKLDGSACDDGNLCTVSDACRLGLCVGTGKPEVEDHAIAIVSSDPTRSKGASLGGLAATASSTWAALWTMGTSLNLAPRSEAEGVARLHQMAEGACELGLVRWAGPTAMPRYVAIGGFPEAGTCPENAWGDAGLGSATLTDESFLLGGLVRGKLPVFNGRPRAIGVSPSGLAPRSSFWLGRVTGSGELLWTVEAQGFLGQSQAELGFPVRTVTANGSNEIAFGVPMLGGVTGAELVDGSGTGVMVDGVSGEAGSVVYRVGLTGTATEFIRVTAAPGAVLTSAMSLLEGGSLALAGVASGGVLSVERDGAVQGQIPTGVGRETLEPWLAMVNPDGSLRWSWHVFARQSFSGPRPPDPAVKAAPFVLLGSQETVWFGFVSGAPLDGRQGLGEALTLSPTWPTSAGIRTTLVQLRRDTGALVRSVVFDAAQMSVTSGTVFRGDPYIAAMADGTPGNDWRVFHANPDSVRIPVVTGIERWSTAVGASLRPGLALVEAGDALRQPLLAASSDALFTAFQSEGPLSTANGDGELTVSTPAIVIRQMNTNASLDCR